MEKIMSKANHTSRLATFEDHNTLTDSELDGVTGGMPGLGTILTQAVGNGTSQAVGALVSNAGYPSGK
jgi:hypothetical protein